MSRFLRFRFSLATLLLAVAWSAVVVWMNVTPRVEVSDTPSRDVHSPDFVPAFEVLSFARYGLPWDYASCFFEPTMPPHLERNMVESYSALAGDVAVGLLLVVVLTSGSSQLRRRVGTKLRRRSGTKLGEQQALDSQAE